MKKKWLLGLLGGLCAASCAFGLASCGLAPRDPGDDTGDVTEMEEIYTQYVSYTQAQGGEPLSYEEWIEFIKGEKGDDGKSAYQIWLDAGHTGSEADFLNWLKGQKGETGDDGKSAYQIWLDAGNTGTEVDFLNWLKGQKGDEGKGILKTEIIDGYLWITYTNAPESAVNVGKIQETPCAHEWSDWIVYHEPSCDEEGLRVHKCTVCEHTEVEIMVQNCSFTDYVSNNDAGYQKDGTKTAECDYGCGRTDTITDEGSALTYTYGLLFQKNEDSCVVVGYVGTDAKVLIPTTYEGLPVTEIGEKAFYSNSTIEEVMIPEGVTSLGKEAFSLCANLHKINIPNSVMRIGAQVFRYTHNLQYNEDIVGDYVGYYLGNETNPYLYLADCSNNTYGNQIYICTNYGCRFVGDSALGYREDVYSVMLTDGVIGIGEEAFTTSWPTSLSNITIGASLQYIGKDAFKDCESLLSVFFMNSLDEWAQIEFSNAYANPLFYATEFYLSNSYEYNYEPITEIDLGYTSKVSNYAFYGWKGGAKATIGASVETIGDYAFAASTLQNITIDSSVKSFGVDAFDGCNNLSEVHYTGTIEDWAQIQFASEKSNPLYYGAKLYIDGEEVTQINISSAKKVSKYAFYNYKSATALTIGDNVEEVGEKAFGGCTNLTDVSIGKGVKTMGAAVFSGCTGVTEIYYADVAAKWVQIDFKGWILSTGYRLYANGEEVVNADYLVYNNTRYAPGISAYAFYNCTSVKFATVGNGDVGDYAFYNCTNLERVKFSSSVDVIGKYAFEKCTSLKTVVCDKGVETIGQSAFRGCSSLETVTLSYKLEKIKSSAFAECTSLTRVNYDGFDAQWAFIDFVDRYANPLYYAQKLYIDGEELTTISLMTSEISSYAFYNCTGLTSVSLSSMLKEVGRDAFAGCENLTEVYFCGTSEEWANVKFENASANPLSYARELHINGVVTTPSLITKEIAAYTFYNSTVMWADVPSCVTSIGDYAFALSDTKYVSLVSGLTTIGKGAFFNCNQLKSIIIPDSVTSIGEDAFAECNNLEWIEVDEDNAYYASKDGVLYNKDFTEIICVPLGITQVVVSSKITSIDEEDFANHGRLKSITFEENSQLTSIGFKAFYECHNLTEIVIPGGVTSIGSSAFYNCYSLTSVTIENGVKSIDPSAFQLCKSLKNIILPDSIESIGGNAFLYCESLTAFVIPDGVKSIGNRVFEGCTGLTEIIIPDTVTTIGEGAFRALDRLTIYCEAASKPNGWNISWYSYGYPVVWDCNNNDVATNGYIYTVIDGVRYGIKDGEAIVVGQSMAIESVSIPASIVYNRLTYSVTKIAEKAFYECEDLTEISISDSVVSIGSSAFENCDGLMSIVIPDSVTSIGSSAFKNCDNLTIYCEAASKPSGWEAFWNYSNCPVEWGYTGE